jgi:hypothetical protein
MALTAINDNPAYTVVIRAYGSIFGNSGRRTAVRAAAEAYFGAYWEEKAVKKSLNDIVNAVEWASARRDDVAHGVVLGGITIDGVKYGSFHVPPEYNTSRTHLNMQPASQSFLRERYRYTSEDIMTFAAKFSELRNAIWDFTMKVLKSDGRIPLVEELLAGRL